MPFLAKSAAPISSQPSITLAAVEAAAMGGATVFTISPEWLPAEVLAASLERHGRFVAWVRLGPEDRDPGMLVASIIAGVRCQQSDFGQATLELMRRQPGPVVGWAPIYEHLARELGERLGARGALVLQHMQHLGGAHLTLRLLGTCLLPAVPDEAACLITADVALPEVVLSGRTVQRNAADLRVDQRAAAELIDLGVPGLTRSRVQQAVTLCEGQAGTLAALCAAAAELGTDVVEYELGQARRVDELLGLLVRAWLGVAGGHARRGLGLALRLGYSHPALLAAVLHDAIPPAGPWTQALVGSWYRIRAVWRTALWAVLPATALPDREAVHRAADYLSNHEAEEQAVQLYLEVGDTACAAHTMGAVATRLMDLGQWATLAEWIDQLDEPVLHGQPWLLYHSAEITAARGDVAAARHMFSTAITRFAEHDDPDGACQSMLAESALAAGQGVFAHARARALAARALAEATGLLWHQAWASWQLGSLAAIEGDFDDALAYFSGTGATAAESGDRGVIDFVQRAEQLTRRLQELHHQRELHQHAIAAVERTLQEAVEELRELLDAPPGDLDRLVAMYGWSRTPPALKLAQLGNDHEPAAGATGETGFWVRALRTLGLRREFVHHPTELARVATASAHVTQGRVPGADDHGPAGGAELTVHLLGTFRVLLNELPVDRWPSGRGRALLKYLVTHREPWPSREVLMNVFWPASTRESARNSLNVAVHGLRKALRAVAGVPVVLLQGETYRLQPDLRLWLDVDEFQRHVEAGRRLEATGELSAATAQYEVAAGLYRGDLLADDPYEEWPVVERERLRLAYLDTLDRLSHLYFSHGHYASCATLCQQIVERDPCREDAHRRLMRCYSRQRQPHLALRQYQACVEALREELDTDPAPATIALHERIRLREPV